MSRQNYLEVYGRWTEWISTKPWECRTTQLISRSSLPKVLYLDSISHIHLETAQDFSVLFTHCGKTTHVAESDLSTAILMDALVARCTLIIESVILMLIQLTRRCVSHRQEWLCSQTFNGFAKLLFSYRKKNIPNTQQWKNVLMHSPVWIFCLYLEFLGVNGSVTPRFNKQSYCMTVDQQ